MGQPNAQTSVILHKPYYVKVTKKGEGRVSKIPNNLTPCFMDDPYEKIFNLELYYDFVTNALQNISMFCKQDNLLNGILDVSTFLD